MGFKLKIWHYTVNTCFRQTLIHVCMLSIYMSLYTAYATPFHISIWLLQCGIYTNLNTYALVDARSIYV